MPFYGAFGEGGRAEVVDMDGGIQRLGCGIYALGKAGKNYLGRTGLAELLRRHKALAVPESIEDAYVCAPLAGEILKTEELEAA